MAASRDRAALAAGVIDLPRARLIAEATSLLPEENARAVQARVLPGAAELTCAVLRVAPRRAVIAADPGGAERRRKQSEARAKICLWPDEENTATLAGCRLPGIGAAAAEARITAMARAAKAAGAAGSIDFLSAQIYLGLLCGTQPLIPPAPGAPPDNPPPPAPPAPRHRTPRPGTPHGGGTPPDRGNPAPRNPARRRDRRTAPAEPRTAEPRTAGPAPRGDTAARQPAARR